MESSNNNNEHKERNGANGEQRQQNHQQQTTQQFQQQQQSSFHFQQHQNGGGNSIQQQMAASFGAASTQQPPPNNLPHQQMGAEALSPMQAFANLGLFGHQQFPGVVPGPTVVPPHLAAAAAAAYGQRLIVGGSTGQLPGQNGCSASALARRNLTQGHGPPSCSASPIHSSTSSSINRSQRCGVCRGCQCKPCGHCTYCQDSPQFGGPGVKKQSCIERRCLRVLENRLQRDAPTFKARIGCNACEDCRSPDCQICLVCLDRRFFNCKYMSGALCAKKRCNNATAMELPISSNERTSLKRPSADGGGHHNHHQSQQQQMVAKRQVLSGISQSASISPHPTVAAQHQLNSNIARILSAASDGAQQQKFGRSSTGNLNSTNSPLSECNGIIPPQSVSPTPPPPSTTMPTMSVAQQLGRPFWASGGTTPSQMLGCLPGQYHFDQMASLAAAAAVGFPQHQVANYPNPYQPKFLNYPKYEYFPVEDGLPGATLANGPSSILPNALNVSNADGHHHQMEGAQNGGGGGTNGGTVSDNLLVPPSYSDVQKVVLQPL